MGQVTAGDPQVEVARSDVGGDVLGPQEEELDLVGRVDDGQVTLLASLAQNPPDGQPPYGNPDPDQPTQQFGQASQPGYGQEQPTQQFGQGSQPGGSRCLEALALATQLLKSPSGLPPYHSLPTQPFPGKADLCKSSVLRFAYKHSSGRKCMDPI